MTYRVNDRVIVRAHGARTEARVTLASPNGDSLILEFPGGLFQLADAGAYVGMMPVLRVDGRWHELINNREVWIELAP